VAKQSRAGFLSTLCSFTALLVNTRISQTRSTARLESELLMSHVVNSHATPDLLESQFKRSVPTKNLLFVLALFQLGLTTCYSLVERRLRGEPTAYIVGKKEFWKFEFVVSPATLIPRPDTETVPLLSHFPPLV